VPQADRRQGISHSAPRFVTTALSIVFFRCVQEAGGAKQEISRAVQYVT